MRCRLLPCAIVALALSTLGCTCAREVAAQESDSRRGVPPSWQTCEAHSDCVVLEHECCSYTPVNRRHARAARRRLPPSTCDMVCQGDYRARCRANRCVRVPGQADPSTPRP